MAVTAPAVRGGSRGAARRSEARWGLGFTAIWVVGFLVFALFPIAMAVYISFTNWSPIAGPFWQAHGVGVQNYATFLHDPVFWQSIGNTLYYAVGTVFVVNVVALPMALILNQPLRGINVYRTIFYLPAIMPAVATVLVFRLLFLPGNGLVSFILTALHVQCDPSQLTCNPADWLSNPHLTMPVVIIMAAWGVGQPLLIYLAGLQSIDRGYYEAAEIDGATPLQLFRHVSLPLLTPAIFFNVVTGLIAGFQAFTQFVIFAGGANATGGPSNSLLTTFWYVYIDGFHYQKMGLASAMAFGLFALILLCTLLNFWGQRRWVYYQAER